MIYRDGLIGAADQTASTNGLEPPLQNVYVVVIVSNQHVWQEKYLITSRHKYLCRNPLGGKTTGGNEQAMHYEDEDTLW